MDQREELLKNGMLVKLTEHLPPLRNEERLDNDAIDNFAAAMKAKMAASRSKGRGGWLQCPVGRLQAMLAEHLKKGDPVDVANFAMMLWNRGAGTAAVQVHAIPEGFALVPLNYTREMRAAWDNAPFDEDEGKEFANAYRLMIEAAPKGWK